MKNSTETPEEDVEEPLLSPTPRDEAEESPELEVAVPQSCPSDADGPNASRDAPDIPVTTQQPRQRRNRALAWMKSTPLLAKLLIPLLIISNHAIFYYGQTANMWRLTGTWKADIHYQVTSTETKSAFRALKIDTSGSYAADTETDLRVFTYAYAIEELWKAHHMQGTFLPRLAAVGLVVFSGVWPHLKLIMLLLTWWFVCNPKRRRRMLSCLSLFGKWSLVDVLTVVVMVGVLNLDWKFTADTVMIGVLEHLPSLLSILHALYTNEQICSRSLGYSCINPKNFFHKADCSVCKETVSQFIKHPSYARQLLEGIQLTGNGEAQMAVSGLKGIYAFCAAVILSILLSFVVDYCDLLYQRSHPEVGTNEEHRSQSPEVSGTLSEDVIDGTMTEPLLNRAERGDGRSNADLEHDRRIMLERQQLPNKIWEYVAWATAVVVWLASFCISMERRVFGALPSLMQSILGMEWTQQYSFWSLGWVTAKAGGWDFMLMATFVFFVIVGPLVRSFLAIRACRQVERPEMNAFQLELVRRRRERLTTWINFLGAFCAWEVFSMSALMVKLLMPSITNTIIMDPRCQMLAEDSEHCLEVNSDMTWIFAMVIVGYFLLSLVSWRVRSYKAATAL